MNVEENTYICTEFPSSVNQVLLHGLLLCFLYAFVTRAAVYLHMNEAEAAMGAASSCLVTAQVCPKHAHLRIAVLAVCVMNDVKELCTPSSHAFTRWYRQLISWLMPTGLEAKPHKLWLQFTTYCS